MAAAFVVTFKLNVEESQKGQAYIMGTTAELGDNKIQKALKLGKNQEIEVTFSSPIPEGTTYTYFFKMPKGSVVREKFANRSLPPCSSAITINDTFNVQHSNTEIPAETGAPSIISVVPTVTAVDRFISLHLKLRYETSFGQDVFVVGDGVEFGDWDVDLAKQLDYNENYIWSYTFKIPLFIGKKTLKYKYLISNNGVRNGWEPEDNHQITIEDGSIQATIEVNDTFRWSDVILNAFTKAPFIQVINRREHPVEPQMINTTITAPGKIQTFIQVNCPYVRSNQKVVVVGSIPELGSWNVRDGLVLADAKFPFWSGCMHLTKSSFPFEYKYVLVSDDGSAIWESNNNRYTTGPSIEMKDNAIFCINEWFICPTNNFFKGLGIYVPLFSLRTNESQGIGSYTDLKKAVDCCNKIGATMIQLLPINDTTYKGDWADSYPYRQVSCFALNPVYIDLLLIPGKLPENTIRVVLSKKAEFEGLKAIDFPAVFKFKMEILRQTYDFQKSSLDKDAGFQEFITKNASWLKPYALFCFFRDVNGTMDFNQWKEYSKITPEEIIEQCEKNSKSLQFTYWVQYIADTQFKESYKYASEHHVALKGDLPIGVNINSVEVWAYPKLFRTNMCAGAPPDDFADDGQNWFFPTYNWEEMEKDNYAWWRARFQRMSELYHTLRVDHILGFFRIWEIPRETCVGGMLGHFYPAYPLGRKELESIGLWDIDRYVKPYVRYHLLRQKFGDRATEVSMRYFNSRGWDAGDDWYDFKPEYNTEKKIVDAISSDSSLNENEKNHFSICLKQLITNVLLVPDPENWDCYHVRTEVKREHIEKRPWGAESFPSSSYTELPSDQKKVFEELAHTFPYVRHVPLWVEKAKPKLSILQESTNMLICGEDLGQITPEIIKAIQDFGFLSLRVQRMSKDPKDDFDNYQEFPYLSVACPSTHDCTSIRGWWEESTSTSNNFWYNILLRHEPCPQSLTTAQHEMILSQNLWSNSMWAVFLLQDLTGIIEGLRRQWPHDERINDPSNPDHHWSYRYPYSLEELCDNVEFTSKIKDLAIQSKRY